MEDVSVLNEMIFNVSTENELSSLAAANRSVAEYGIPGSYFSRVLPCHIPLSISSLILKWLNRL